MNTSRSVLIATLGFGLLQAGCIGAADDIDEPVGELEQAFDPNGSTNPNGHHPDEFHFTKGRLLLSTKESIYDKSGQFNNYLGWMLANGGEDTFKYAMNCAAPTNSIEHTGGPFGRSLLNTTAQWLDKPLGDGARNDLFACMLAHLNPLGTVDIRLTGHSVTSQATPEEAKRYPVREALWVAETDVTTGTLAFHVWPFSDLLGRCGSGTGDSLIYRVCAEIDPASCGLTVHNDADTECTEVNGFYTCNQKPAIQTWLKAEDVDDVHPECKPMDD
jgi:hypothetical protein